MQKAHRITALILIAATALTVLTCEAGAQNDQPVDFAGDVLPTLSDKCFVCHGPAGEHSDVLRLDSFAAATRDLGGYRAIDPAAPEKSALLARINSPDNPMPPADAEKQLTANERDLLSRWVRQGGAYATHWAFVVRWP